MSWLKRNAQIVEAIAAVVTAFVALAALIGIKYQLDAANAVQKAQSAREAYRAHLALGVAHPEFSSPNNVCSTITDPQYGAYVSFC